MFIHSINVRRQNSSLFQVTTNNIATEIQFNTIPNFFELITAEDKSLHRFIFGIYPEIGYFRLPIHNRV